MRQARVFQDKRKRNALGSFPWYLDFTDADGQRRREKTDAATKWEALELLRTKLKEVTAARERGLTSCRKLQHEALTVAAFATKVYLPDVAPPVRKAKTHARDVDRFKHLLPAFGSKMLRGVDGEDVERYIQSRLTAKAAANTILSEVATLSAAFNMAVRRKYADRNPCDGIKRPKAVIEEPRYLREDSREESRLFDALPENLRDICRVALLTGMRRGELIALMWRHIDWNRKEVTVKAAGTKTNQARVIPMPAELVEYMKAMRARSMESRYVFPWQGLRPVSSRTPRLRPDGTLTDEEVETVGQRVSIAFTKAARAAGVEGFSFHNLRDTYACRLAQAGVPILDISKLLGHRTIQMTLRYATVGAASLHAAVSNLNRGSSGAAGKAQIAETR